MGEVKELSIKNRTYHFFGDMIHKKFLLELIKNGQEAL